VETLTWFDYYSPIFTRVWLEKVGNSSNHSDTSWFELEDLWLRRLECFTYYLKKFLAESGQNDGFDIGTIEPFL